MNEHPKKSDQVQDETNQTSFDIEETADTKMGNNYQHEMESDVKVLYEKVFRNKCAIY